MRNETLRQLTAAARWLLIQPHIVQTIDRLKVTVRTCEDPFVWSVIDTRGDISQRLPAPIKSAWIFVLKKDTRSICHFHPNSIQHMLVVEGQGSSEIGGIRRALRRLDPSKAAEDHWTVIDKNVPHEFFPEQTDMVVLSFHTCAAEDLIEIECGSGHQRHYEMQSTT
jgi:mannose-6-phosphate isomerase-like protein (cupin superfamily)